MCCVSLVEMHAQIYAIWHKQQKCNLFSFHDENHVVVGCLFDFYLNFIFYYLKFQILMLALALSPTVDVR